MRRPLRLSLWERALHRFWPDLDCSLLLKKMSYTLDAGYMHVTVKLTSTGLAVEFQTLEWTDSRVGKFPCSVP